MNAGLNFKKEQLLKAIVKEYISTATPVGSLNLGEHYGLGSSSATLRNRMSELENLGYLKQPHPSSGRIPTDLGYRHYVDLLMEKEQLSPREIRIVAKELESGAREIDDLLKKAAKIIAEIGQCTILVLAPQEQTPVIQSLQLVKIGKEKILFVVVTRGGQLFDRVVEMEISKERLEILSHILNERLSGRPVTDLGPSLLEGVADEMLLTHISQILKLFEEILGIENQNRLLVEGTDYLLEQPEFLDVKKLKKTLGLLKKEEQISQLLSQVRSNSSLRIVIGYENPLEDFQELSVIATPYEIKENWFGTLAVIGPTRMNYDHLVPLTQFVAAVLSNRLQQWLV